MPIKVIGKVSDGDKHSLDVDTLVHHRGFLYSGAQDGKIIKWDKDMRKVCEAKAHACSIYSICGMEDTIYSCSSDGTVKSWTLDLTDKATLLTAECEFWKVFASDGILYSGDDKGMLLTYKDDFVRGRFELLEPIKDMRVEEGRVYISNDADVIMVTISHGEKNTFAHRKIIPGRAPIHLVGGKLAFADRSAKGIIVHDNSNDTNYKEIAKVENAHEMVILSLTGREKSGEVFLYTAGWDKTIKEWKLAGDKLEPTATCCIENVVNVMCMNKEEEGILYAAGADGYIFKCQI